MLLSRLVRRLFATRRLLVGWFALGLLAGATAAEIASVAWSAPAPTAGAPQQTLGLTPARAAQIRQLIADPAAACLPAGAALSGAPGALAEAAATLRESPLGAWLLDHAAAQGVVICLDAETRLAAYYRAGLRLIGVQASLAPAARTLFLAHELAHVLQHPDYSNNRSFAVGDLILMHRVREAAAEAIATRALWQLQRRGRSAPWQAKLATGYGDIARVFAAVMAGGSEDDGGLADDRAREDDGARADDGARELAATRAAFDQWFAWPLRLEQYDRHMLDHLARIARDELGLTPPRRRLTHEFLRGIGRHAGNSFLAAAVDRPLTAAYYRAGLSPDNAARLAAILASGTALLSGAAAALPAAAPGSGSR